MQANVMSSEYDEISDMHKKVVRVRLASADIYTCKPVSQVPLCVCACVQISSSLEPVERTTQDIKSKFLPGGLLTDGWTQQVGTHPEDRK